MENKSLSVDESSGHIERNEPREQSGPAGGTPGIDAEYFRAIFETAQDSIFIKDLQLKYTHVNPAMERLFGSPASELVGRTDEDIFGKEVGAHIREIDFRVLNGESIEKEHTKLVRGTLITFHVIKVPLRNKSGEIIGLCGIARDTTEHRKEEKARLELEEKYRLVVENANEAIVVVQDKVFKFVNPKTLQVLGYSEDELASRTFLEFIHPDDREMVLDRHLKRLKGEVAPHQYEFRIIGKDGNVKWFRINAVLINWEGKPATLNFLDDITEKRKTEEELLKVHKLESIGDLAGGIAHDFNNILTAILGNISLAKMYALPGDKMFERLTEAEKASFRAKDLTQQLLTFSRGGTPIVKTVSIKQLLRDSVSFALSGSNVKCEFFMPDNLYPVEIDESQIRHVINNIIVNADQAMPEGGTIKVRSENVIIGSEEHTLLKAGRYIRISIEDQGVGIPEENLPRIFDPYFTTKQEKSGLGLTIAYSIIKRHRGYITVESRLGVGATFHIYLPASPGLVPVKKEAMEKKPVAGKGKVLIMDDEEMIRDFAYEALSSIGYEVSVAANGTEAVELYKYAQKSDRPFDAVILDLTIHGGMGGKEAIKDLIRIDPAVKAIVSSGYFDDPVVADFKKYGFKGVIEKPYKVKELSEILFSIIAGVNG